MHKAWKYVIIFLLWLEIALVCVAVFFAPRYFSQMVISFWNWDLESLIFFEGPLAVQLLTSSILWIGVVLLYLGVILLGFWLDKRRYGFPIFDSNNNDVPISVDGMD